MRVAEAIVREARSDEERAFLVAELMLELKRVRPAQAEGCLPAARVRAALKEVAGELAALLPARVLVGKHESPLARYLADVVAEARA